MTTEADVYDALKYHVEVDRYGIRTYRNAAGQLHREDGPAIEYASGTKEWWIHNCLHREDGPAIVWGNGGKEWRQNGKRHRIGGPAVIRSDGSNEWWLNGVRYTEQAYRAKLAALEQTP